MFSRVARWRMVLLALLLTAALTLAMGLADWWGVPKAWVNGFFLVVSIAGYAGIGLFCRTSHYEEYYVAARRIAAPFNGMATAADWLSAASFIGLTGLVLSEGLIGDGLHPGGLSYVLGWTGGFCLLGFLFAGKLNAMGTMTVPEWLGQRFDSSAVRWIAAWGAVLCSSVYLVAQIYGVGLVASMLSGLTFELGVFLTLGGILLCSFLGGMRAVTWTQVVQCVVIVASMVALAVAVAWKTQGHPLVPIAAAQSLQEMQPRIAVIEADPAEQKTRQTMALRVSELDAKLAQPMRAREQERQYVERELARLKATGAPILELQKLQASLAWRDADLSELIERWQTEREHLLQAMARPVGFQVARAPGLNAGWLNSVALVVCLVLGTTGLPHILMRSFTTPSPREARRSIVWALFFIMVVYLCAASLAVLIKSTVLTELVGAPLTQLPDWAHRLAQKKLAILSITDYNHDGIVQYADIWLFSDYLILGVTDILHISPVLTGLIAAGALAAALSTADGLLLTISSALMQDMFFPLRKQPLPPFKQVMSSKILLMAVALLAAWFATTRPVNILYWVTCAFSLAASTFFPVLLLGFYWTEMRRAGAIVAMLSGLGVSSLYIAINHPAVQSALGLLPGTTQWWSLEPVCAGVFGVPVGLLAGVLVSLAQREPKAL